MKKVSIYLLPIALLFSCSKKESAREDHLFTQDVKYVLNQTTIASMKQAHILLGNEDKEKLWLAKYNDILENDKNKLTTNQFELVKSLKKLITDNGMEKLVRQPEIGENFLKKFLNEFKKNFNSIQTYLLIESPYYVENFSIFESVASFERLPSESFEDGSNCTCRYDIYCETSGPYDHCDDATNKTCTTTSGCGVFGSATCKGECK